MKRNSKGLRKTHSAPTLCNSDADFQFDRFEDSSSRPSFDCVDQSVVAARKNVRYKVGRAPLQSTQTTKCLMTTYYQEGEKADYNEWIPNHEGNLMSLSPAIAPPLISSSTFPSDITKHSVLVEDFTERRTDDQQPSLGRQGKRFDVQTSLLTRGLRPQYLASTAAIRYESYEIGSESIIRVLVEDSCDINLNNLSTKATSEVLKPIDSEGDLGMTVMKDYKNRQETSASRDSMKQRTRVCDACPFCDDICDDELCRMCLFKKRKLCHRLHSIVYGKRKPPSFPLNVKELRQMNRNIMRAMKVKLTYTPCEIRRHVSENDCWIVAHGSVYDVTSFMHRHPAGPMCILLKAGADCSRDFDFHSSMARNTLWRNLRLGEVVKCEGCPNSNLVKPKEYFLKTITDACKIL